MIDLDINTTQPRRLTLANHQNIQLGDIYFSIHKTLKASQHIGIVAYVDKSGFSCYYNDLHQNKKDLKSLVTDEKFGESRGPSLFYDCERGIFLRRMEDGRLTLVAATKGFLADLEILTELYSSFTENINKQIK